MEREISSFAKSLSWGWNLSHIFLSCSDSTKTNSLLGGCAVRKINAVSLILSPRSLSRTAAARLKHFEDWTEESVSAFLIVLTSNSNSHGMVKSLSQTQIESKMGEWRNIYREIVREQPRHGQIMADSSCQSTVTHLRIYTGWCECQKRDIPRVTEVRKRGSTKCTSCRRWWEKESLRNLCENEWMYRYSYMHTRAFFSVVQANVITLLLS